MKKLLVLLLLTLFAVNTFAGIQLSSNFTVNTALPIDDRMEVATLTARDALPALRRWEGMIVYVKETETHFALIGGLTDDFWAEIGGGKGGIAEFTPDTEYEQKDVVFYNDRIYYANGTFISGPTFNPLDWTELSSVGKGLSGFDNTSKDLNILSAPHKTLTEKGTGGFTVDHGSNQRLYNGSLEDGTKGWTCSGGTITSTNRMDQQYSLNLYGLAGRDMECYQDYATADEGTVKHEANAWFRFIGNPLIGKPTKGEICARQNGVNVNCVTFDASKDQWHLQQTFADAGSTTTGIYFKIYGDGVNTYNVLVDKTLAGVYTATNSFMNVTNTTKMKNVGPITITASTTSPTKGGVIEDKILFSRNGSKADLIYSLKTTTGWGGGSGYYRFNLPIVDGVQLEFDDEITTGMIIGTGNVLGSSGGSTPTSACSVIKDNATQFSVTCDNQGSTSINLIGSTFYSFANGNQWYSFNIQGAPIKGWQQNLNVATSKCLEGPVKCANNYSASITTGSGLVENENVDWITSCTAANPTVCTLREPTIGFLTCTYGGTNASTFTIARSGYSTSTLTIGTYLSTTGAITPIKFDIKCSKSFPDNTNHDNISVAPLMDIRSTEFLTGGFDYIDGKSIYRRCHKVASDITANGATIVNWPTNLNPINATNFNADAWVFMPSYVDGSTYLSTIKYYRGTGIVNASIVGAGMKIGAGTKICMDYTR